MLKFRSISAVLPPAAGWKRQPSAGGRTADGGDTAGLCVFKLWIWVGLFLYHVEGKAYEMSGGGEGGTVLEGTELKY